MARDGCVPAHRQAALRRGAGHPSPLVGVAACPPGSGAAHADGRSGAAAGPTSVRGAWCDRRPLLPCRGTPAACLAGAPHLCVPLPPSRLCGRAVSGAELGVFLPPRAPRSSPVPVGVVRSRLLSAPEAAPPPTGRPPVPALTPSLPRGKAFGSPMEQALKPGVWRAVGLSPASCGRWWWGLRYRSTREQRLPPFAPPAAGGDEAGPARGGDGGRQLPPPAVPEASRAVTHSRTSHEGLAPQRQPRPWHKSYERGARPAAPGSRELWSSGEGDSSKARKRQEQKPLLIERTKGSEILFGIAPCSLALSQSRRDVFKLFLKESSGPRRLVMSEFVLQAVARGVPVHHVKGRELDALCRGRVHQGVCLEVTPLRFKSLEEAEKPDLGDEENPKQQLIWLVLEQIQDPMNLGALLRSAYFLGVDRVVTSQRNSCPLTPTVSKASSGAVEVLDVYSTDDIQSFLKAKTAEGWEVVGTVTKPEGVENVPVISCLEFRWSKPVIIVIGNEGDGLSLETQLLCHRMLAIPPGRALHPGIESLNVSVATGIFLHSICSQKLRHSD